MSLQPGSVDADGLARTSDGKLYVKISGDASITGTKIAVIGDSGAAQSATFQPTWPERLRDLLNASGVTVTIKNFAINGASFFQANTVAVYGANTQVAEAIEWTPDVVIFSLGGNDTLNAVDARTVVQVQADAALTISTLRAALPSALLIYGSELGYDVDNFASPGVTLKNKGVMPAFMTLKAAGILTNCWCSEMLDDDVGAAKRGRFADWVTLDTAIKANGSLTGSYTVPFFKIGRLGLMGTDGEHLTAFGQTLAAAAAFKGLKAIAAFTTLVPGISTQIVTAWQDVDTLFTSYLTDSGDGYVRAYPSAQIDVAMVQAFGAQLRSMAPDEWFLPHKTRLAYSTTAPSLTPSIAGAFQVSVFNGPENTVMEVSIDGGAFSSTPGTTDSFGFVAALVDLTASVPAGAYAFRWRLGNEVYGPTTITYSAAAKITGSQGAAVASAAGIAVPSNRAQITGTTQIDRVNSSGWTAGSVITLMFQGAVTVRHNQANSGTERPIMLAGAVSFVASANDQLTLQLDSDNKWYELARAVI